ncbi:Ig-like domain-containing protein [Curvibacter sp. RS43]|uniref:Ig-like domain-containing protein n=1 Tax=Curvibacter microcysteis TaxID=3026419 RepID=UPI00235E651E|nr:Ig-like domain-containing protein [Curvibacter sp. RS43]MDD0810327.1 Ig-like domain-containing protein [Curvibacter sp. RS43]
MNYLKYVFVLLMAALLTACGGGGGSAGTTSGGSSSSSSSGSGSTTVVSTPTLVVSLADSSGVALSTPRTLKSGLFYLAQAKALDGSANPIANQVVTFSTDSTLVTLAAPTALTDANGVASVKMTPLSAAGAGSVAAVMTYNTTTITGTAASYQVTPAAATGTPTLALALTDSSGVALSTPRTFLTGSIYKARVTVLDATSAPVSNLVVQFSSEGVAATISPSSALTDANGVATVQIVPGTTTGAGSVKVSGVVNGTTYSSAGVSYQIASTSVAATMNYVQPSTPVSLVVSNASSGNKLATASFKLANSQGVGVSGQPVSLSLNAQSISAGVTFLVNGVNTSATQTFTTDQDGLVSISVASGTLPTPVLVTATAVSNSNISATSVGLAVTNGRPTQLRSSIAASILSVEASPGGTSIIQGVQSTLTVLLSDRLGNPIPAGTVVNLITSHGQIAGSCVVAIVSSASQCSAVWTSVSARPTNGWFTVLAYLDGEEDFVDANGNNQYDGGETFYDVGQAFLPKDAKASAFNSVTDQPIAGGMTGALSCNSFASIPYQMPTSCDGVWSSTIRVRLGVTMNWASSFATITSLGASSKAISMRITDDLGNAMPSNSDLLATLVCPATMSSPPTISGQSRTKTPNAITPVDVTVTFSDTATGCTMTMSVTTPAGSVTRQSFLVP